MFVCLILDLLDNIGQCLFHLFVGPGGKNMRNFPGKYPVKSRKPISVGYEPKRKEEMKT